MPQKIFEPGTSNIILDFHFIENTEKSKGKYDIVTIVKSSYMLGRYKYEEYTKKDDSPLRGDFPVGLQTLNGRCEDLNNDGLTDIIAVTENNIRILMYNDEKEEYVINDIPCSNNSSFLKVFDYNNDNLLDVLIIDDDETSLKIIENKNQNGAFDCFTKKLIYSAEKIHCLITADCDSDDCEEIIVSSQKNSNNILGYIDYNKNLNVYNDALF